MTGNEIRKKFLDFFASKGHTIVKSDSLVPKDDPTVLFTTAGMQQFKPQFMGQIDDYTRAATSQKCLRTDDLAEVGQTDFHHTFFEMLGNFSFGDYFKKEAIAWGWEFLTKELGIPEEKLWVTVYTDDDEAADIWIYDIGFPKERLVRCGDKENFWPANAKQNGPNGPCGPCSEIHYDYGPAEDGSNADSDPGNDTQGRFSEVWNLVFTQYNRKDGGQLDPLPSKNIDTGMGLERLVAVVQGKTNNFDTDLFAPILKSIDDVVGKDLTKRHRCVIADHIRAIVFVINDGVVPSNEGRGYVLKKLIVNVSDIAIQHGKTEPVITKLVPAVIEAMGEAYPDIKDNQKDIEGQIKRTEEAYMAVLKERVPQLEKEIEQWLKSDKAGEDLGEIIFRYRDTYGLTFSTIGKIVRQVGVSNDEWLEGGEHFNKLMMQQVERSRASSKMQGDVFANDLNLDVGKTNFIGYDQMECKAQVLKLFIGETEKNVVKEGDDVIVVLDQTVFYGESGGQIGDTGTISQGDAAICIKDTQKFNDVFLHYGTVESGEVNVDDEVQVSIEANRRQSIMKNHTATHILQATLTDVLGDHIKQQGSLVAEDRLRFDFTHPQAVSKEEVQKIEDIINTHIQNNESVSSKEMSIDEAKKLGARAYFAEKYGDVVRVVSIGDYSKEFCGGTHLQSTSEIESLRITTEGSVAQGIRRIEAVTGSYASAFDQERKSQIKDQLDALLGKVNEAKEQLQSLGGDVSSLEDLSGFDADNESQMRQTMDKLTEQSKQIRKLTSEKQFDRLTESIDDLINQAEEINGKKIITQTFEGGDMKLLKRLADVIKQKSESSVVILGAYEDDSASILISVSNDLVENNIRANDLINEIAPMIGGRGGGRPQLAQAGSKEPDKVKDAVEQSCQLVKERIAS